MNNKRIGILTLSASDNCGSLLQAYALREFLKSRFIATVDIINFESVKSKLLYDNFPKNFWKRPKRTFFMIKNYKSIKKQKKDYQSFRDLYLEIQLPKFSSQDELELFCGKYDILIAGSDQIWNINMFDYDDAFMFPWKTSSRKIAYAPSLGDTSVINGEKSLIIKDWIMDFDYLSVREDTGKSTLEKLIHKDIEVVADPTLLLDKERWSQLAGKRMINREYIFFYSWAYRDEQINKLVTKFANEKRLPVYVINPSKWRKFSPSNFGFQLCSSSGPISFLNLMKYAKYVFVQSFHGLVFANIFRKNFAFLCESNSVDFRAKNLLSLLDQESQIVRNYSELNEAIINNVHYSSNNLDDFIFRSISFLDNAIKGK